MPGAAARSLAGADPQDEVLGALDALRAWRGETAATLSKLHVALGTAPGLASALSPWPEADTLHPADTLVPGAAGLLEGLPAELLAASNSLMAATGTVLSAIGETVILLHPPFSPGSRCFNSGEEGGAAT